MNFLFKLKNFPRYARSYKFFYPVNIYKLIRCANSAYESSDYSSARPIRLHIESSSRCNLECVMCPISKGHTGEGTLSFTNFKQIFNTIKPLYVDLSGFGEPLLNKELFEIVKYAHRNNAIVKVTTNATILNDENFKKLCKSGLTSIVFSLDGATKSVYEKVRVGANFDRVILNIKKSILSDNIKRNFIGIQTTLSRENYHELTDIIKLCKIEFNIEPGIGLMSDLSKEDQEEFIHEDIFAHDIIEDLIKQHELAKVYAQQIGFNKTAEDLIGNLSLLHDRFKNATAPCFMPFYNIFIAGNGDVFPCCYLSQSSIVLGNMFQEDFNSIWNGDKYRNFRRRLMEDRASIKVCRNCTFEDWRIYNIFKKIYKSAPLFKRLTRRTYK